MTKVQIVFMCVLILGMIVFVFSPGVGTVSYVAAGLCLLGMVGNIILTMYHMRKMLKENAKAEAEKNANAENRGNSEKTGKYDNK
ncbi:MAG: hypothetical protein PUB32_05290 [Clostridiales bacterium]|nr:hypothetical protein [Clostridiales bacterium]